MRKGHDQHLVDVICQHNKDGSMIPMRVRLTDEDGAVQTYLSGSILVVDQILTG
ncbi:MAG: hypothetical protein IJ619_13220 [Eubacterium sp.]|nr:hypothetical protein [Eubacterium sp.]